uniref:Uncharacterized protein n=1 Tax=Glossina austeni TaxID=7395 RepID=A0A1A9UQL8_GLOAU
MEMQLTPYFVKRYYGSSCRGKLKMFSNKSGVRSSSACDTFQWKTKSAIKYFMNENIFLLLDYAKMRGDNRTHIRHIYHAENTLRRDGKQRSHFAISTNISVGEQVDSESRCRERFALFKSGDISLQDKPGRSRPSDFDEEPWKRQKI